MELLGIGAGRCGSMSWCYWLDGLWEPFNEAWSYNEKNNRRLLARLKGQTIVVCHRLTVFLPLVLEMYPDCRFLWMRRGRDAVRDSWLHMTPWYGDVCAMAASGGPPAIGMIADIDKYLSALDTFVSGHLSRLPQDQWREVWLENADRDKRRVAEWLGRGDLLDKPFCHVAINPLHKTSDPVPEKYYKANKGEFA